MMITVHNSCRQNATLRSGRSDFWIIRDEDGRSDVTADARHQVQNRHSLRANESFQVSHGPPLEDDRDGEMEDAGVNEQTDEDPVELIGLRAEERKHAADAREAVDLAAQRRVFVPVTTHEIAVLFGGDAAESLQLDAAWTAGYLQIRSINLI